MYWNPFLSFVALVGGGFLIFILFHFLADLAEQRHEYRMAKLKNPKATPIRKDIA